MNVLSLCDGMCCGHIALDKLGIKIDSYYASEIKEGAIKATTINFPDVIQIGDVNKVYYKNGILYTENGNFNVKFDLVIFGSPCQSFSKAMKTDMRTGLEDHVRSGLFKECYRVLKEVNPRYFLMENVIMDNYSRDYISSLLGVQPIRINSSLVSAQIRDRYYWTNIPNVTIPEDRHIKLQSILKDGYTEREKARCLMANDSHGYFNGCNWNAPARFHRTNNKAFSTMIYPDRETYEICIKKGKEICNGRPSRAEYFNTYKGHEFDTMRYFWKEERARLQTVPEKYVECMSEKDAANLLGDGWTVDVISHILKGLKQDD